MSIVDAINWLAKEDVEDPDLCGFTKDGWYFWDETQTQCYGPHETWRQAYLACEDYARQLKERSQAPCPTLN